jgi:alpha-L-fucosidase
MEFERNMTIDYMNTTVKPQITELMTYNPDIWWFDGAWKASTRSSISTIHKLVGAIKNLNPLIEINDRIPEPDELCTYRVYEDRYIPAERPDGLWEHINTIGLSWGANKVAKQYKSGKELYKLYRSIQEKGGKFLLNIGPLSDGTILPQEESSLKEFSDIIHRIRDSDIRT